MKKFMACCSILLLLENNFAQNTFAVWQGFSHYWTYNHRLNRLGDLVAQSTDDTDHSISLVHTAATGLGKDSAAFTSRYTIIKTADLASFAGKINFHLTGKEGNVCHLKKIIQLHPGKNMQQKEIYTAILNGFDIVSSGSTEKLQSLHLSISNCTYDKVTNTLTYSIDVQLNVDCSSLECNLFNRQFDYSIEIHYLLIAGETKNMATSETEYHKKTAWDTKTETHPEKYSSSITPDPRFQNIFLAFKSMDILLNTEQHYLGLENAICPFPVLKNKTIDYSMNLYFSNWSANMKHSAASGGQAIFSYKQAGWCIFQGTLQVIQMNSGSVEYRERNGNMFWEGKNKTSLSDAAKSIETVFLQ